MTDSESHDHPCDVCGSDEAEIIPAVLKYTGGKAIHVCRNCGFVYVRRRRSAGAIAEDWSKNLFSGHYTAHQPFMKARHYYVAEVLALEVGLKGRRVCDIGAGEGQFLDIIRKPEYGASVFGIEPSRRNCELMTRMGIECFAGTIEDYMASPGADSRRFDLVTMMWTLENCEDPKRMIDAAYGILDDGGYVQLATQSRILVPFKKPLHYYLSAEVPLDTHCFRFSANTQRGILAQCGFEVVFTNRYIDDDMLLMIAQKTDRTREIPWKKDDYRAVIHFFDRWDSETQEYYADDFPGRDRDTILSKRKGGKS